MHALTFKTRVLIAEIRRTSLCKLLHNNTLYLLVSADKLVYLRVLKQISQATQQQEVILHSRLRTREEDHLLDQTIEVVCKVTTVRQPTKWLRKSSVSILKALGRKLGALQGLREPKRMGSPPRLVVEAAAKPKVATTKTEMEDSLDRKYLTFSPRQGKSTH